MDSKAIVVWAEIPVIDMDKSVAFYSEVFGHQMSIDNSGPNPIAILGSGMNVVGGHLYPGKPAADGGNTVHLAVPDTLDAAVERCQAAGGEIVSPAIAIAPGRFVYAKDLDGNSIALFERAA